MHNLTRFQLNIILLILCVVTTLIVVIGGVTLHNNGEAPLEAGSYYDFDDSWILVDEERGDSVITLPYNADVKAGDTVTITHKVPEDVDGNTVLFFASEFQAVEVSIDDNVVYSYGVNEKRAFGKSSVPVYNMADVSSDYEGGNISITFLSNYSKYSGKLPIINYGNKGDVLYTIWQENAATFIMSVLLVVFSIAAIIIYIFMGRHRKEHPAFGYLVVFLMITSIWSVCDNRLVQLFTNNMYAIWLIKALAIQIIPIAYLMYVRCFADKKRIIRIIDYGIWMYITSFITSTVFQIMGLCDYVEYTLFIEVLIVIGLIIITLMLSTAIITFGKKSLRDNVISNIVLIVFIVISVILNMFNSTKGASEIVLRVGLFIYVLCILVVTERYVLLKSDKKKESEEEQIKRQKKLALDSLNPNFIFAALKLTLGFVKSGSETSQSVLVNLSKYIRYKFNALNEDSNMVDFREELEHIRSYLYIEKLRYSKLTVSIEDKVIDFKVPSHSIEPLVENAIKHGLGRRDYEGTVVVRSYERKDSYAVQIIDNGVGFDVNNIKKDTFTSILNVRERIESIDGDIEIASKKGKGTVITIKFPKVVTE